MWHIANASFPGKVPHASYSGHLFWNLMSLVCVSGNTVLCVLYCEWKVPLIISRSDFNVGCCVVYKTLNLYVAQQHNISCFNSRSSRPEVFLRKSVLKICSKFREEHPFWSVQLYWRIMNWIKLFLWYGWPTKGI